MGSVTDKGRDLYGYMESNGLLEFGSVITELEIHQVLDITYPEIGTRKDFSDLDLLILGATDYVRNILLGQGKAFTSVKRDYRIPLPSETKKYIDNYISSADKKLRRALKLSRNMPSTDSQPINETGKILLKREYIRKQKERQDSLD